MTTNRNTIQHVIEDILLLRPVEDEAVLRRVAILLLLLPLLLSVYHVNIQCSRGISRHTILLWIGVCAHCHCRCRRSLLFLFIK